MNWTADTDSLTIPFYHGGDSWNVICCLPLRNSLSSRFCNDEYVINGVSTLLENRKGWNRWWSSPLPSVYIVVKSPWEFRKFAGTQQRSIFLSRHSPIVHVLEPAQFFRWLPICYAFRTAILNCQLFQNYFKVWKFEVISKINKFIPIGQMEFQYVFL